MLCFLEAKFWEFNAAPAPHKINNNNKSPIKTILQVRYILGKWREEVFPSPISTIVLPKIGLQEVELRSWLYY